MLLELFIKLEKKEEVRFMQQKSILDEVVNPKDTIRNLVREVNIICKLNYPSIIKFIGFSLNDFEGNSKPVLITEYMPNGSLSDLIEQERRSICNPKYNFTRKLIIIFGISSAMSYLHAHNIIHRDLKPDNILIDSNLNPKLLISDFQNLITKIKTA